MRGVSEPSFARQREDRCCGLLADREPGGFRRSAGQCVDRCGVLGIDDGGRGLTALGGERCRDRQQGGNQDVMGRLRDRGVDRGVRRRAAIECVWLRTPVDCVHGIVDGGVQHGVHPGLVERIVRGAQTQSAASPAISFHAVTGFPAGSALTIDPPPCGTRIAEATSTLRTTDRRTGRGRWHDIAAGRVRQLAVLMSASSVFRPARNRSNVESTVRWVQSDGIGRLPQSLPQIRSTDGDCSGFDSVAHTELSENVRNVDTRRLGADEQLRADLTVREATGEQLEDGSFACSEGVLGLDGRRLVLPER